MHNNNNEELDVYFFIFWFVGVPLNALMLLAL